MKLKWKYVRDESCYRESSKELEILPCKDVADVRGRCPALALQCERLDYGLD